MKQYLELCQWIVEQSEDDMGWIYGVQARALAKPDGGYLDQLKKVIANLSRGIDDRGDSITFYNKLSLKKLPVSNLLGIASLSKRINTGSHYQPVLPVGRA